PSRGPPRSSAGLPGDRADEFPPACRRHSASATSRYSDLRPIASQRRAKLVERTRVQHVGGLEPRAARDEDAPPQRPEADSRVGVARHDKANAAIPRELRVDVVEIQPVDL